MIRSSVKTIYIEKPIKTRIFQGDVYRDINFHYSEFNHSTLEVEPKLRIVPYLVILNQDCDLEEDYKCRSQNINNTQIVDSILACPAFQSEKFKEGAYLKNFGIIRERIDEKGFKKYKNNRQYSRFHYLEEDGYFHIPSLILDFKLFYTIPRDFFYKIYLEKNYLGTLDELFRENLSIRFANYLSRIGLPIISPNQKVDIQNPS